LLQDGIDLPGYTQGGNHMRLANNRVQQEKSDQREDWEFLWHRLAEVYVYTTGPNGMNLSILLFIFQDSPLRRSKPC
jgi:hypothetical protein